MRALKFWVLLFLSVLFWGFSGWYGPMELDTPPASARAGGAAQDDVPKVYANLILDHSVVQDGGDLRVGVFFEIEEGWHIYWRNSGDAGFATDVRFSGPGMEFGELVWPAPEAHADGSGQVISFGYENRVLLWASTQVSAAWGQEPSVEARVDYLACKIECIPGSATLSRVVHIGAEAQKSLDFGVFEQAAQEVPRTPETEGMTTSWEVEVREDGVHGRLELGCPGCAGECAACGAGCACDMEVLGEVERYALIPDEKRNVVWKTERVEQTGELRTLHLRGVISRDGIQGSCDLEGVTWVRKPSGPVALQITESLDCEALKAPIDVDEVVPSLSAATSAEGPDSPGLAYALILAFIGGMILNLMPCVFPVLAIKVFAFVKLAHESKTTIYAHSMAYTVGVVGSMLGLAAVVVGLKMAGTHVGWGFQFQEPLFIVALSGLLVLFAMNLFGAFEVMLGIQTSKSSEHTLMQSVGEGVLAVVLATPCSAPFLGTAVGFALSASYLSIFLIFLFLGLGLAFPFVVLTLIPGGSKVLPKPGQWMMTFKQVLGFALLGTVVWLVWILGQSTGVDGVTRLMIFLLSVSLAGWGFGKVQFSSPLRKWVVTSSLVLVVLGTGFATLRFSPAVGAVASGDWEVWSHERVAEERAKGRVVFVDFTADWCITCKVNEGGVLASESVSQAFAQHNVVKLKGDWTRRDEEIRKVLESFGKGGVPLYLVYGPGLQEALVLPELLTEKTVAEALAKAVQR